MAWKLSAAVKSVCETWVQLMTTAILLLPCLTAALLMRFLM